MCAYTVTASEHVDVSKSHQVNLRGMMIFQNVLDNIVFPSLYI